MNRQYIGARYVPKFYENSSGSAEWVAGVAYEALTIVTYNGNSYTSKKVVPANIGNPSANSEYWASTGIYNEQVESLRREVESVAADTEENTADIAALEKAYYDFSKRKVLFIGDSYAEGWTPDGSVTSWTTRIISIMRLTGAVAKFHGGTGFVNPVGGYTFGNLGDSVTDKDSFTDIVICGGRNDAASTYANITSSIASAISHYRSTFPNAIIHIGMVAYSSEVDNINMFPVYQAYHDGAVNNGAHYLYGVENAITNQNSMSSDGKHPNNTGQLEIAKAVASALAYDYTDSMNTFAATTETGWTGYMEGKKVGSFLKIIWSVFGASNLNLAFNSTTKVTSIRIANVKTGLRFYSNFTYLACHAMVGYKPEGSSTMIYELIPATLRITRADVMLEFRMVNKDRNAWAQGTLDVIHLFPGSATTLIYD